MNKLRNIIIASAAFIPFAAFAALDSGPINDVKDFITGTIIPFLIVIATLIFIVGILRYITAGGDEEKIKQGRNMMIFGIIALAVMIAMWGIVNLLVQTTGVGNTPIPGNIGGGTTAGG